MTEKLEEVITSLQTMAPEVWAEAVGAVQLEGFFGLFLTALFSVVGFKFYQKSDLKVILDPDSDSDAWFLAAASGVVVLICTLGAIQSCATAFEHLAFPQYVAVKEMLGK